MKILSEKETRRRLINVAKHLGCEHEIKTILNKYDLLLTRCTNEEERKAIGTMGAMEIHRLFGGYGTLEVNGKTVCDLKV